MKEEKLPKSCGHVGNRRGCALFSYCPFISASKDFMGIGYSRELSDIIAESCERYRELTEDEERDRLYVDDKIKEFFEYLKLWPNDNYGKSGADLLKKIIDLPTEYRKVFDDFLN